MLLIDNDEVELVLDPAECIRVMEDAYVEWGFDRAAQFPATGRMDLVAPSEGPELNRRFIWGAMAGVIPKFGIFAVRQKYDIHFERAHPSGVHTLEKFCREPGKYCGFLTLASIDTAEPLAIVKDGVLQHARVAATAAVAAKHLAKPEATRLAIIGSGGMAHSHVRMLSNIRPIRDIRVFSATETNRDAFAAATAERLGIPVIPTDSPEDAVRGADIVSMCTSSLTPIFSDTDWIEPGMHITGVVPVEVGEAPHRADVVILHQHGGIVQEVTKGYIDDAAARDAFPGGYGDLEAARPGLATLAELVTGRAVGRTSNDQATYFHNLPGCGIQFAAVGAQVYRAAKQRGLGRTIPTEWFLQDIRD